MLVIHGLWAHRRLHLWAEESGHPAPSPPVQGRAEHVRPHPFAAAAGVLADVLAEVGEPVSDLARKAAEAEVTLWLPSEPAGPLGSPELTGSGPAAGGPPRPATRLAPWRVPALGFDPAGAQVLLAALGQAGVLGSASVIGPAGALGQPAVTGPADALGQPGEQPEQAVLGASVSFLAALAALGADLAGRGRVLPGLDTADEGGYAARWRPVLAGPDALRARELTAAMPPACRATSEAGEQSAAIVTAALESLTDAAVRARIGSVAGFTLLAAGPPGPGAPLAERWAAALASETGALAVSGAETALAAQLAFALWAWQDAAQEPPGPVRTCFRLIEPDVGQDDTGQGGAGQGEAGQDDTGQRGAGPDPAAPWRVQFALQSTDDPSLLLAAADIWAGDTAEGWAAAGISYPEDELLAGLGRASRLFPQLDTALQSAAPESVELDTAGALEFLKETGPLLAGAGFGVLLPDWVRRSRLGLKLTTRSRSAAGPGSAAAPKFGLDDLVSFRYELAVGDQTLDAAELAELARLKVPLVRLRGQWVELDDRHLNAALDFLARGRAGTMRAGDALLAGLGAGPAEVPLTEVDADGWLDDLLSGAAETRLTPMTTPASFRGELRPYQERGLAWLSFLGKLGLGAVLADDMGLGKSPQTLALLQAEKDCGGAAGPTLLICPMSLVGNWQREAARFTPELAVYVHHGADRLAGPELADAMVAADLVLTTYGVAARDRAELIAVPWVRVVCDEAQNIKNPATRQAQAVRAIPARSRIALTGTPVENRLAELWSIMEFTSPGLLGPAEQFRRRFAIPIERNAEAAAAGLLRRITAPFILRRLKTDKSVISDLPDKLEMRVWCNLTPEQASLYQATVDDMMARIEAAEPGIERRGLVLATMAKLKQVCNHPAHLLADGSRLDGRSGKLARLEEIGEEIVEAGDKALCFTQYAEFGRLLQPYLAARLGCEVYFLHGGTAKKRRDELVTAFQASTDPAIFLLSLKAGGTGLNLTAASHVIHIDRWWNPAVEDQATDRAFRIGQRRNVQVRKFVCVGTVEERIDAMIEDKKALADAVVGTGESWLTELSVADLRRVLDLSPDAVSQ